MSGDELEILKLRIKGSIHVGVYVFANDYIGFIPPGLTSSEKEAIMEILDIELVETKIAETDLVGVFVAGNNNGVILPRNILDDEIERLKPFLVKHDLNMYISRAKHTAMGNIVLANNRAAVIGKILEKHEAQKIAETLGVEYVTRDLMYLNIPGSIAVVTDKGGLVHPDISDDELRFLEEFFKVNFERATVNAGIPFIKSGIIANNHGIIVGEETTGPEILRIKRGLEGG